MEARKICPVCKVELLLSVREGVEIDCCAGCGGIWLDHGELMKILIAYPNQTLKKNLQTRPVTK